MKQKTKRFRLYNNWGGRSKDYLFVFDTHNQQPSTKTEEATDFKVIWVNDKLSSYVRFYDREEGLWDRPCEWNKLIAESDTLEEILEHIIVDVI